MFLRYHNLLCDRLQDAHNDWDDEKIFQMARKIVGAIFQKVTYSEYLKTLLGESNAKKYNLLKDDSDYSYQDDVDATLNNEFATGAFRFGHSSIPDYLVLGSKEVKTEKLFMRPQFVLNDLDDVTNSLIMGRQQKVS